MQKMVYRVDVSTHNYTPRLPKGNCYETPEGWAVVFFDANGNSYSPLDRFAFKAEAQAFIDAGLKDGVYIP